MKKINTYISTIERISSIDDYISTFKRISSIGDYISEKLHINKDVKVITVIDDICKLLLKDHNGEIYMMQDVKDICESFNNQDNFGLTAICADDYDTTRNTLKLCVSPNDETSDIVQKYGNVFIKNKRTNQAIYFIWITSDIDGMQNCIDEFVDTGYVLYVREKGKYKIYTKQDIYDMY